MHLAVASFSYRILDHSKEDPNTTQFSLEWINSVAWPHPRWLNSNELWMLIIALIALTVTLLNKHAKLQPSNSSDILLDKIMLKCVRCISYFVWQIFTIMCLSVIFYMATWSGVWCCVFSWFNYFSAINLFGVNLMHRLMCLND